MPDQAVLSLLDYSIIALYLLGTLYLGYYLSKSLETGKDFFLAGRALPWWAVGASLVATDIGATDVIGVGGAAYSHGLAVANFEWIGCIPAMIVAAYVFVPYFWRCGVYTIPELLERRYDARVRTAVALCWLTFMACNIGVILYAASIPLQAVFGWDPRVSVLLVAVAVGVYTFSGGLAAIVYSDVAQVTVMICGCLFVTGAAAVEFGGLGPLWEAVQASGATRTSLVRAIDDPSPFPWSGILFGLGLILGPAYWIGNQAIVQRALGTRSEYEAKASYLFGALLKNLIPIIIAVPGMIAMVKYPQLKGDEAVPALAMQLLPIGLRGVFLSAFLAALMSSVDSYLNSAATMITYDIYKGRFRPEASDERLLTVGRIATTVLMVWGVVFAFFLSTLEQGVYSIFQTLMSFFQGPAFAVLLLGVFWRRANALGAFIGFLLGVATAVTLFLLNHSEVAKALGWPRLFVVDDAYLYYSIWAFLTTAATCVLVSLLGSPESHEKRSLVLSTTPADEPTVLAPASHLAQGVALSIAALLTLGAAFLFFGGSAQAATPLHAIGAWQRSAVSSIPLWVARLMFLVVPIAVLIWTWRLPREQTRPPASIDKWTADLRIWSTLALAIQITIYACLG